MEIYFMYLELFINFMMKVKVRNRRWYNYIVGKISFI